MTKKLYYLDMYRKEAHATIKEITKEGLILDQTIFFPEGGGQIGDSGYIDHARVVDTQKKISLTTKTLFHKDFPSIQVGSDVVHILESDSDRIYFKEGQEVKILIDWDRRYKIMKMHSAAHVVYHFILEEFGFMPLKGCYISAESSRFDFSLPAEVKLRGDLINDVENKVNLFINSLSSIDNIHLDGETEALYWVCSDIKIPCGGMHVKNTGEIGNISLKRKSQGRTIDRVYITIA